MDDYNQYVTAVNKIFDYIAKMRAGWASTDNKNYLDSLEEFKNAITTNADAFKKPPNPELMVEEEEEEEETKVEPASTPTQPEQTQATTQVQGQVPAKLDESTTPPGPPALQSDGSIPEVQQEIPSLSLDDDSPQQLEQAPSPIPSLQETPAPEQLPQDVPPATPSPVPTLNLPPESPSA